MLSVARNFLATVFLGVSAGAFNHFWQWFLVPLGATPALNYKLWVGLLLLVTLVGVLTGKGKDAYTDEQAIHWQVNTIATVLFIWALGALTYFFL